MFLESIARPLLVAHLIAAAVLVGSTTHHLLWCRGYLRGHFGRKRGERRFAWIVAAAFSTTFLLGNLLYPTYKVRVREEYFDAPSAVEREVESRRTESERLGNRPPPRGAADLAWVGHLFDVKEHWVALGWAASLVLLLLSRLAHPSEERRTLLLYLGLSAACCATAWTGAIIGVVTASFRAVGGAS